MTENTDLIPTHRSHSQVTSYLECGEKYRLERIVQVPHPPAWYFIGGSAVHQTIELFEKTRYVYGRELDDRELEAAFRTYLQQGIDEGLAVEPNLALWRAGGRATQANPNKEDGSWWFVHGVSQVKGYRRFVIANDIEVWTAPDGRPGIELSFEHELEGITVRGAVDQIVWHSGELVVRDLKSGSRQPNNPLQLELYAHVLADLYPDEPWGWADYYMTRKAATTPPHRVDPDRRHRLVAMYAEAHDGIMRGYFPPNPSAYCGTCSVRQHCRLFGTDDTYATVGIGAS